MARSPYIGMQGRRGDRYIQAEGPKAQRAARRPHHTAWVQSENFELNPFLIVPVFANETLRRLDFQSRKVSDAVVNPLSGWWNEYFIFYVPVSGLIDHGYYSEASIINPDEDTSSFNAGSTSTLLYTASGAKDFVKGCMEVCTEYYFREPGQTWDSFQIRTGLPAVALQTEGWWNTLADKDTEVDPEDATVLDAATTDTLEVSEIESALRAYRAEIRYNLSDMDFDDWLVSQGVRRARLERSRGVPEIIRYWRDWSYPTNTVGEDGTVNSQLSWSTRFNASKRRYFEEPGFIFGMTCTRSKMFLSNLIGTFAGRMNGFYEWTRGLPDEYRLLRAGTTGVAAFVSGESVEVIASLDAIHTLGDQFVNVDMGTDAWINVAALPDADLSQMGSGFPTQTDARSVFSDTVTPATYSREDISVSLDLLGPEDVHQWRSR